ncbi:MAG: ABC transporter permease subunit [Phycisphaerales bacterium]|nr:ABC transporter permease subunit [Phycisphaerales bacterium]
MTVLHDIGAWLWRLLPANPIMVRVVTSGGKRIRHLWARLAYLVVLFVVVIIFGQTLFSAQDDSLAEMAKNATNTFKGVSLVQLALMAFIAPVFAAGAITQEKDSNTFDILLTTPLSSGQIILGSLLSRLFFVWVLLLSGLPIFCITMIFGGVTTSEVFYSFGLAATTALVMGSLAITISIIRRGTRRTIFSFFVGVAIYLLGIWAISLSQLGICSQAPTGTDPLRGSDFEGHMSWLAPIHPFLALFVVTGQTPAPKYADVAHYGWPFGWMLAHPAAAYMTLTTLLSIVLIAFSLIFVRAGQKEGEITFWSRLTSFFKRGAPAEERRRTPRRVWDNPIAWREANTRGSAGGSATLRYVFLVIGSIAGLALVFAYRAKWSGFASGGIPLEVVVRKWLVALIWIQTAVILLVVTNTAATTLTREKESLTMELLLTTPLTSKYIIFGMLRGLVSFVVPMVVAPTVTLLAFVFADLLSYGQTTMVTTPEAVVLTPLLILAFCSLSAMIGLQFSLASRKTVQAVMISTSIVLIGSGALFACAFALGGGGEMIRSIVYPFTPISAIQILIDHRSAFEDGMSSSGRAIAQVRITRTITALIALGLYIAITLTLYANMVRSFDMTVRKQSA